MKRKTRNYTLRDLSDMALQLGGRWHFQIIPIELTKPDKPNPEIKINKKDRKRK